MKKKLIFLIDDDIQALKLAEEVLNLFFPGKFELRKFSSGSDVLEALKKDPLIVPDLALVDFAMPDMNGYEVAKKIRERTPETKVFISSGFTKIDLPPGINEVVDRILWKTDGPQKFIEAISEI